MTQEGKRGLSDSEETRVFDDAYLDAVASLSDTPSSDDVTRIANVPDAAALRPGEVLAGKYRVERVLGAGGMGVVVAARHISLDAQVALKFMTHEARTDDRVVARFLREARATARLRGEHVIRVSDVGELDSGAPYMVMEHLQGQDLAALLASLGPPPVASAVEYAIQACEGLDEAHLAGIVHRDIKPSNLFLTRRPNGTPCIKILDFGISKSVRMLHQSEYLNATSDHAVFGTPLYMAPEQMRAARDVDARADLWSLGASLYELLTGTVPFPADSIIALAYRVANEGPASLRERRPEIPEGLERIVLRCLERDPDRRYPDARSLGAALDPYRAHFAPRLPRLPRLPRPHGESGEDDELTVVDSRVTEPAIPAGLAEESLGTSSVSWAPKRGPDGVAIWRRSAAFLCGAAVASGLVAAFGVARTVPTAATAAAKLVSVPAALSAAPIVELVTLPVPSVPTIEPPTVSISDLPSVPLRPAPVATPPPAAPAAAAKVDPDGILLPAPTPASSKPRPMASSAAAPRPTASAAPGASNCTPPYDFDELGEKIAKPECAN